MSPSLFPILIFVLIAISVGGVLFTVFQPRLAVVGLQKKRLERILLNPAATPDAKSRKRSVEEILKEIEEKQKAETKKRRRPTLLARMRQAGLPWTKKTYWLVVASCGLVGYLGALAGFGFGLVPSAAFGIASGLMVPHLYVNLKRARRLKLFSSEFPNAVDVVVRGIKSGLPLVDCLKIIAAESQEPVRGEFKAVVEDQTLGLPMDEAIQRLADRVPLQETSFLAIVITIQNRTGGSLSEALGNLSRVLRERKKMKAKIKAMSAEAKASGGIIGSLPVVVAALVYLTSPDYISMLFTTLQGNLILAASGLWMLIGILVMRKMINFDF